MSKPTRAKRKVSGLSRKAAAELPPKPKPRKKPSKKVAEPAERPPLPAAWRIGQCALGILWRYRLFFLILTAIYLVLDLLLVRSVLAFDVASLRSGLSDSLRHGGGLALGGLSIFSSLFTAAASGASGDKTGAYHFFVVLLISLVIIWALRQIFADEAGTKLRIKRAFYQSTTPLIPFMLLVFLLGLQFVPLFITLQVYAIIVNGGIVSSAFEQVLLLGALLGMMLLTIVWLARTIIALYIVTLPGMEPLEAYRNAKVLVQGRRLSIIRKLLFLPLALFVMAGVIMVPAILIWAPLAQWLFFVLTGVGLVAVHAYLYSLYRELLA